MVHSMYTMPIIVINMGGEMIYILSQRLKAQSVQEDKAKKVLQDVLKAMYAPVFIDELFKPQNMYSMTLTKGIFERLAHSSIMRLNKTSMDKLFDLMAMGFKRQILGSLNPQDFVIITLNHLESLKLLLNSTNNNEDSNHNTTTNTSCLMVMGLIQNAIDKLITYYSNLSVGQWWTMKQSIARFLQDKKVKVSLFLQNESQKKDGTLVLPIHTKLPYTTECPGMVRYYEGNKVSNTRPFDTESGRNCRECRLILDLDNTYGLDIYQQRTNKLQQTSIHDSMNPSAASESKSSSNNSNRSSSIRTSPGHTQLTTNTNTNSDHCEGAAVTTTTTDVNSSMTDDLKPLINSVDFYKSVEKIFQSRFQQQRDGVGNVQSPRSSHITHHAISHSQADPKHSSSSSSSSSSFQSQQSPALMKLSEYNASPTTDILSSSGAKKELSLLADLLGLGIDNLSSSSSSSSSDVKADSKSPRNPPGTFRLSLFPGDDDFFDDSNNSNNNAKRNGGNTSGNDYNIIEIDGTLEKKSLQQYFEELDFKETKNSNNATHNNSSNSNISTTGNKRTTTNNNVINNNHDDDDDDLLALMDSVK